jgi:hypothetical protein
MASSVYGSIVIPHLNLGKSASTGKWIEKIQRKKIPHVTAMRCHPD